MSLNLNNAELLELLKRDVGAFNQCLENNPDQAIDFSSANLQGADLADADLEGADLAEADFQGADLRDASLWDAKLQAANLRGAILRDASLTDADLREADLREADLRDASLQCADLQGADLAGANLQGAKFSLAKLKGAKLPYDAPAVSNVHQQLADAVNRNNLNMGVWHCGTTHCRAGWVVTLAGKPGRELEAKIGTNAAAALIYMASDPGLEQIPSWFASKENALADIQAMAAK